jgi:K+-dependent Na+/Ca+ exchanger-like protein
LWGLPLSLVSDLSSSQSLNGSEKYSCSDDFFVPALEVIADWWELSPDVAGATLMAAGGSSPELFTNLAGTFLRSDVGFGAIVGSAVFNVLFVVGFCTLAVDKPMELDWYCLSRDSLFYAFVLIMLAMFFGVISPDIIEWYEALILHLLYYVYVYIMSRNDDLRAWAYRMAGRRKAQMAQEDQFAKGLTLGSMKDDDTSITASGPVPMRRQGSNQISFMKLMTTSVNVIDIASTRMELEVSANVNAAFQKYDTDGNGTIDSKELKILCQDLGCPEISDAEVTEILQKVDSDGNGVIDLEEFTAWFLASSQRLRADVSNGFHEHDDDKDGCLTAQQVGHLIRSLSAAIGEEDIADAVKACATDERGLVTKDAFMEWYEKSDLWKHGMEVGESMADEAEGLSLSPPTEGGAKAWIWYLLTLPYVFTFIYTLPDVRRPGRQKYAYLAFFLCLCYMGLFSYFMVSWTETIGATAQIPSVIMGLTFLAAGTSVPDMLSAVIVAKQGEGDQAVSSSIGSNVFDICIGLAFPWLLFIAVYQEAVTVTASNLFISILVLVLTLCILIGLVRYRNWSLPRSSGYWLIFFYFCYVAQQLALTKWDGAC